MRAHVVSSALLLASLTLVACGSKKEAPPTDPPKGSAVDPGSGSGSDTAAGSGSDTAAGSGSDTAAGSGSDTAAGSGSDTAAGSGSGSGSATAVKFDDLSRDEKMDFMKKQVVPKMKPLFQKFDPKEFAGFGCKTCHGKDPQKAKYKMPSPDIDKLDFAKLREGKQHPETAKWMTEVVKPEMAKLLGEAEQSQSNPDGFGCLHCHQEKK